MTSAFDPYQKWLGIADDERPVDHYRLLGIPRFEHDVNVITTAADRRMARIRQYQTGPRAAETQRILNELSSAKLCLLDPASRTSYDEMLLGIEAAASEKETQQPVTLSSASGPVIDLSATTRRRAAAVPQPYYVRPWFPLAAVFATGAVATIVWFMGSRFRSAVPPDGPPPIHIPRTSPLDSADVQPIVVLQEASGEFKLSASMASVNGTNLRLEAAGIDEVLSGWQDESDVAVWRLKIRNVPPQGAFRVRITYTVESPGTFLIGIDDQETERETRRGAAFVTDEFLLTIPTSGTHRLTVRALGPSTLKIKQIALSFPFSAARD